MPHYARLLRTRRPKTRVTRTGPDTLKCGRCKQTVRAPYQASMPAPCGCDWLWYDGTLAAYPNRSAALERVLARNRRLHATHTQERKRP